MYSCVPVHALQCTTVPQSHLQCTNVPPYPPMYYYNMFQLYPQYATMPLLYPPIYQYASSLHSIPLCGPLYPPVYPYAPTPSPSLPLRSHIPVCLLTDRFSTTANSVTLSVFFLIIPWSFHALWKLKKELTRMSQQKTFVCLISNYVSELKEGPHFSWGFFMGNH